MYGVENESGVFFAKKGYYKGREVTVTHHSGSTVWLEDYPIKGDDGLVVGCWVPSDSVSYSNESKIKGDINHENNKRGSKQVNKKTRRQQGKTPVNRT